jgi:hypothetical protein
MHNILKLGDAMRVTGAGAPPTETHQVEASPSVNLATQVKKIEQAVGLLPAADQFAALADIWSNKTFSSNHAESSWQKNWQNIPADKAHQARLDATDTLLKKMDPDGKLAEQFKRMNSSEDVAADQPSRWLRNHSDAHKLVGDLDTRPGWFKTIRNAAGLLFKLGKPEKILSGLVGKSAGEKNAQAAVRNLALNQLIFRNIKDPPNARDAGRLEHSIVKDVSYLDSVSQDIKEISGQFASLDSNVRVQVLHFVYTENSSEPPKELKSLVEDIKKAGKNIDDGTVVILLAKMLAQEHQDVLKKEGLLEADQNTHALPVRGIRKFTERIMNETKP